MKAKLSLISAIAVLSAAMMLAGCSQLIPRSDSQVAADVQNKINTDANLPNKQITIRADKGVVTLTGTVASEAERNTAASDAGSISGVKTVINNLTVGETTTAAATPAPQQPAQEAAPAPAAPAPAARSTRRSNDTWSRRAPTRSSSPNYGSLPKDTTTATSSSSDTASTSTYSPASNAPTTSYSSPAPAAPVEATPVTVPDGTILNVRLIDAIDTSRSQSGEMFKATLDSPVTIGDKVAIPADADVTGRIVELKQAGHYAGQTALALELTQISYNGKTYQIRTEQYAKTGSSRGKRTAGTVGGGAAVGAILGGIIGGGKGAAIGAASGAGAGAGVQAISKPEVIRLPSESLVNFKLEAPVTVTPANNARASRRE